MTWRTRPRKVPISRYVIHWTGGPWTRTPAQIVGVLAARNLSVHDIIAPYGRVLESEAYDRVCLHAGPDANENSVGVEVICPGFGRGPNPDGVAGYYDTIHGRTARHLPFTKMQLRGLEAQVGFLRRVYGLAPAFPTEPDGVTLIRARLPSCRRPWTSPCGLGTKPCRRHFAGILGHYHVTGLDDHGRPKKRDPGSQPLLALAERLGLELR